MRSLHCAQTHTVIGRISGKGNLIQARAIWGGGVDKILRGAEERMAAGESDFEFFLLCCRAACALPNAEQRHCQYPYTH